MVWRLTSAGLLTPPSSLSGHNRLELREEPGVAPEDDLDFDPWSDTTPGVGEVRDDPFDDWPTATAIGEVTGPRTNESLVARSAHGGTLPRWRRPAAWLGRLYLLLVLISIIVTGILLSR
jgi:hypothetical protein